MNYKKTTLAVLGTLLITAGLVWGIYDLLDIEESETVSVSETLDGDPVQTKIERYEYFHKLLRDPATGRIPENIRARELEYAKTLPTRDDQLRNDFGNQSTAQATTWKSVGPNDEGGRTRALEIDQTDPQTIIAGGVSGGIWKSTDGGNSWTLKTDPQQNMSVTYLEQDPTTPTTWYYASGEFQGNSASDRGFRAFYFGTGIFKSIDNGETWTRLSVTEDIDTGWNSQFDFISKIAISPNTGTLFAASNGWGILRSTDGGSSFSTAKGGAGEHRFADVAVASDGTVVAVLSQNTAGSTSGNPGVFVSTDDGQNWTEITPGTFPSTHDRSVVSFAPSNPEIVYVFTKKGSGDSSNQGVSFHKLTLNSTGDDTLSTEDRSANLPNFGSPVGGVNVQGGYNMLVSVKPDNPNFVMVGATNLFRSRDGFDTAPTDSDGDGIHDSSEKDEYWIGGYAKANNISQYSAHHPDQHSMVYHPSNPDTVYSGHDGGLSLTTNITASSVSWSDKDDGYITSQFYTVALPAKDSDRRILGGTQDNGSPFFELDSQSDQVAASQDISSGDGSYAAFTDNFIFTSSQGGVIRRYTTDSNGQPGSAINVHPISASNQLFIHPYALDPNDESVMFYPDGATMWRNTSMDQSSPRSAWTSFTGVSTSGYNITTLEVSTSPSDILYYAASSQSGAPKIFRMANASSSTSPTDVSMTSAASGAYVHDIAINPKDADEVLVVMSNYNITGIFHTSDGGSNWTQIEGNLTGNSTDPGPSIRSAAIVPPTSTSSGSGQFSTSTTTSKKYYVGTSTGVFSTETLSGSSTSWSQEGANTLGYAVSEYLTSRTSDGAVAVATHGRGIYTNGKIGPLNDPFKVNINGIDFRLAGLPLPATPNFIASVNIEEEGSPPNPPLKLSDFSITEDGHTVNNNKCILTPPSTSGARLADIVFVIDNSGSMGFEQDDVVNNIISFVDTLQARGVDFALGLTRYGQSDTGTNGQTSGGPIFEDGGALTTNASYFKDSVLTRNITSGGNEPGYYSIEQSISNFAFRSGSQKIIVIATDETPAQDTNLADEQDAIDAALSGDVTVYASTESSLEDDFKAITDTTGGQIFDIFADFSTTVANAISQQVSNTYILSCLSPQSFDGTGQTLGNREVTIEATGNTGRSDSDIEIYDPGDKTIQNVSSNTLAKRNKSQPIGQDIGIEAEIKSFNNTIAPKVELVYRNAGTKGSFKTVEMSKSQTSGVNSKRILSVSSSSEFFTGAIPDTDVQEPGMEFYIKVSDTSSTSQSTQTIPGSDPQSNAFGMAVGDNAPPVISHSIPSSFTSGVDLTISAEIEDTTDTVSSADLFYRSIGNITYKKLSMSSTGGNQFEATIPGSDIPDLGVEYYIQAEDSTGVTNTEGTSDFPIIPGGDDFATPSRPGGISFQASGGQADISWNAIADQDLFFYKVYKGTDTDRMSVLDTVDRGNQSFTDANLNPDETQFYGIKAVDSLGNESQFSRLVGQYSDYKTISTDWQMVSVPLGANEAIVKPQGVQLVSYNGAYQLEDTLKGKKGYWMKGASTDSIEITGSALTSTEAELSEGWNMIFGLADTIGVNAIIDSSAILGSTPIFQFADSVYKETSQLKPKQGYWVFATGSGKVDLVFDEPEIDNTASSAGGEKSPVVENLQKLKFERNGIQQEIYLSPVELSKKQKQPYRLPPVAPSPSLDVRVDNAYKIADGETSTLNLRASSFPVQVTSDVSNDGGVIRIEAVHDDDVVYYDLHPGQSRLIENGFDKLQLKKISAGEAIANDDLFPNYPNPFNPTTTIKYQLANETEVSLQVYDVLGRKVRTLVNEVQRPGVYTVNFDASRLASGVYFVRLNTDSFTKLQKMTLIK